MDTAHFSFRTIYHHPHNILFDFPGGLCSIHLEFTRCYASYSINYYAVFSSCELKLYGLVFLNCYYLFLLWIPVVFMNGRIFLTLHNLAGGGRKRNKLGGNLV
ncbi:hypothetical protein BDZ91DRAFT_472180 [Kalaharituber pfeilii]|nr:hypothetical protein BDZ91DRAFT_472180 [Kalaharituber pfeilii]